MKKIICCLSKIITAVFLFIISGCGKEFLEKKSNQKLLVPKTISDFWALMDNSRIMNAVPFLNIISSDDLYTTDTYLPGASTVIRNSYLWVDDVYEGGMPQDWTVPYEQIFYCNIVLDGLKNIDEEVIKQKEFNEIKGTALFFRAFALYNLTQIFTVPYHRGSAINDLGLPIPLVSDVNIRPIRGTLQQIYDRVLIDLKNAEDLLPIKVKYKTRPCKAAALGLLARISLMMSDYEKALVYSNAYLDQNSSLIDYNVLNVSASRPFPNPITSVNEEVVFYASLISSSFFTVSTATIVDSVLYKSYANNDLRKVIFFNDRGNKVVNMKGNYTGSGSPFAGIVTDEVYLIKAECQARKGLKDESLETLDHLLIKRINGTYIPAHVANSNDALALVLMERRKELVFRNIRWSDLKRLNQEPAYRTTLKRVFRGKDYILEPGDRRYVFQIPDGEVIYSGIEQNNRY